MNQRALIPVLFLLFLVWSANLLYAQKPVATVMFYNLENLYDTRDDAIKRDEEFLPGGERHWSNRRLVSKLTAIARVIVNTGFWEPPAVVGMCEVENREVLEKLVATEPLRSWNYQIIHKDSPDKRGIDVAAIYRDDLFKPISYRYFPPVPENAPVPETREILFLSGVVAGIDTIGIFFNHWPSRYGGLLETRPLRMQAATRLHNEIEKLCYPDRPQLIAVMGDFNDRPGDESLRRGLEINRNGADLPCSLVNLSGEWEKEGKGTIKFQSQWMVFDQVIVNRWFLRCNNSLCVRPGDARIVEPGFLLGTDEVYAGKKLKRTYLGPRYQGGISDHLPVLLVIRRNQ
jgi:endonuclease/exonuclease/phosphatase family metal-dependent hydrolase